MGPAFYTKGPEGLSCLCNDFRYRPQRSRASNVFPAWEGQGATPSAARMRRGLHGCKPWTFLLITFFCMKKSVAGSVSERSEETGAPALLYCCADSFVNLHCFHVFFLLIVPILFSFFGFFLICKLMWFIFYFRDTTCRR